MYHYHLKNERNIREISYTQNNRKAPKQIIFIVPLLEFLDKSGSITTKNKNV